MTRSTLLYLSLACCAVGGAVARGQSLPAPKAEALTPKRVRQVGGERGPKVEIRTVVPDSARGKRAIAWRVLKHDLKAPSELPRVVREELRVHALRMARLQRVGLLAVQAHDQATLQRAERLLAREQARHREQLSRTWPASQPSAPPQKAAAPPRDDDQDDDRQGDRETEDEGDPQEGQP
jgi:hypothetical protein